MPYWEITDKGDPDARALVDGEATPWWPQPHYSRQTPGAKQFTRNGQNLVFITADCLAVWVTFRPTPGKAVRPDGLDGYECALFRNESGLLSSTLIREATELTWALWGPPGVDGLFTFIKPEAVRTEIPGYCYRRAGWHRVGNARDGKPRLRAPKPVYVRLWDAWPWHGTRGGKLRVTLAS